MNRYEGDCPCRHCPDRRVGCRAECVRGWKEWEAKNRARRDQAYKKRAERADVDAAQWRRNGKGGQR